MVTGVEIPVEFGVNRILVSKQRGTAQSDGHVSLLINISNVTGDDHVCMLINI